MLLRLVNSTHHVAWWVVNDVDFFLRFLGINIRELIEEAIFTEEDFIKFRIPTNQDLTARLDHLRSVGELLAK